MVMEALAARLDRLRCIEEGRVQERVSPMYVAGAGDGLLKVSGEGGLERYEDQNVRARGLGWSVEAQCAQSI
jgi:hypothetical protein